MLHGTATAVRRYCYGGTAVRLRVSAVQGCAVLPFFDRLVYHLKNCLRLDVTFRTSSVGVLARGLSSSMTAGSETAVRDRDTV